MHVHGGIDERRRAARARHAPRRRQGRRRAPRRRTAQTSRSSASATRRTSRATTTFWKQFGGDTVAQLFKGRWIAAPASTRRLRVVHRRSPTSSSSSKACSASTSTTWRRATRPRSTARPRSRSTDPTKDGTLYVATEGEPYPLKIEGDGKRRHDLVHGLERAFELEAPEDAVDISQLHRRLRRLALDRRVGVERAHDADRLGRARLRLDVAEDLQQLLARSVSFSSSACATRSSSARCLVRSRSASA